MNHGRHLAEVLDWNGLGMERICHYWRRHLSSVSKSMGFRSVKKCALAEGQLASIAFLMSLSTLHPYMNCCRSNKIQTIGPKVRCNLFRASQTDFNTFGRQPRVRQSSQDNVIINSNQNTIIHLALIIHCSYASRSTNADTRKTQQNVELSLAGYQSSSRVSLAPKLILLIEISRSIATPKQSKQSMPGPQQPRNAVCALLWQIYIRTQFHKSTSAGCLQRGTEHITHQLLVTCNVYLNV